jgi:hypothetical protein
MVVMLGLELADLQKYEGYGETGALNQKSAGPAKGNQGAGQWQGRVLVGTFDSTVSTLSLASFHDHTRVLRVCPCHDIFTLAFEVIAAGR